MNDKICCKGVVMTKISSQGTVLADAQGCALTVSRKAIPVLISNGGAIVPPTGVLGVKTKVERNTDELKVVPVMGLLMCCNKLPSACPLLVVTWVETVGAMMFRLLCPDPVETPHERTVAEGVPKVPLLVTPALGK